MTAFEDYVNTEMPQRPVLIKGPAEATGDPNLSAVPKVQGSPIGTLYLQDDVAPKLLWQRLAAGITTWETVGSDAIATPPEHTIYVNTNYTGLVENGSETSPFKIPQDAIDYVELQSPSSTNQWTIIWSGYYFGRVNILKDGVNVIARGYAKIESPGGVNNYCVTYSNATLASLNSYRAGGSSNYGLLVNSGSSGPNQNVWDGVDIVGKLEFLGVEGDDGAGYTNFADGVNWVGIKIKNIQENTRVYAKNANLLSFFYCSNINNIVAYNVSYLSLAYGHYGSITHLYYTGDPDGEPSSGFWGLKNIYILFSSVQHTTLNGEVKMYFTRGALVAGNLTLNNTTSVQTPDLVIGGNVTFNGNSQFELKDCTIIGNFTIAAGNTGVVRNMYEGAIGGTINDPDKRLIWTGTVIDPPTTERYVGANTKGFQNGAERFPFTTVALARASSSTAVIKMIGFIENADVDTGTETVDEFPDTSGSSVEWKVEIKKGTNVQLLSATTVWDAATNTIAVLVTDTSVSIGAIDITLSCDISSDNVRLRATAISDNWSVKVISRLIS